jgi:hypothetical protein
MAANLHHRVTGAVLASSPRALVVVVTLVEASPRD